MVNNWNGTITKEMFDLSDLTQYSSDNKFQDSTFEKVVRQYLKNCKIGISHLTGEGSLLDYHDEIEEELVDRGEIAIIEYPFPKSF